eukprot:snap_masked-scaffold_9-processed-gene-5.18-mRNA-1 protein AED:1.00 eAED:1.00 QI:0/0/0/0/1/1/2/0/831
MKSLTIFYLFVQVFLMQYVKTIDINVGIFSSMSVVNNNNERTALPTYLTSALALLSEINNLNKKLPTIPYQLENNLDPEEPVEQFICKDVNLIPYIVDTVGDFSKALSGFSILSENVHLQGIIGPVRSSVAVPLSFVSSTSQIPIVSFGATSPRLNDINTHKFFTRTKISDDKIAQSYVDLLLELDIHRAVVLYIEDEYGSGFKDALFSVADSDEVDMTFDIIPHARNAGKAEINDVVGRIKQSKLNVVIAITFTVNVVSIMEAAARSSEDEESWVGAGKLWMFADAVPTLDDILNVPNATLQEKELFVESFNGMFLVSQVARRPETEKLITAQNERFDSRLGWNETQLEKMYSMLPGGPNYLFGTDAQDPFDASKRFAANFPTSSLISDLGYFSLDALIVFRQVVDKIGAEDCSKLENFTGVDFLEALSSLESIPGVTGDLKFDASGGTGLASGAVQIVKMNLALDKNGEIETNSERQGLFLHSEWDLENLTFNNDVHPLFTDRPERLEKNEVDKIAVDVIRIIASSAAVVVTILFAWILRNQHYPVIAAAQPWYLILTLLGVMIMLIAIFFADQSGTRYSYAENRVRCNLPYYLFSFGLTIIYTSLLLKLTKIISVYQETVKQEKLAYKRKSEGLSLAFPVVIILINIFLLLFIVLTSELEFKTRVIARDEFDQVTETYGVCTLAEDANLTVYILLFIFHGLLYVYGVTVVLRARKIPSDFHDGFSVAMSVFAQVQLSILAVPIMTAIGPEESTILYLVQSLVVLLFCAILLGLLFASKVYRVLTGETDVFWHDNRNLAEGLSSSYVNSVQFGDNQSHLSAHTLKTNSF